MLIKLNLQILLREMRSEVKSKSIISNVKTFFYFGYASNLDTATLGGKLNTPPALKGVGVLPHHGFRFDFPNLDGSARANLIQSENESVYGLIYEINREDVDFFLTSEPGYGFHEMQIHSSSGSLKAYTFISAVHERNIFPKREYLDIILKGGQENGLPRGYLAAIVNRAGKIE